MSEANPDLTEVIRRALGLALQILEDAPEWLQPRSNMEDLRRLLVGEDTGRNGLIIVEAVATALVWRTQHAISHPVGPDGFQNRLHELHALFELVTRCHAGTFAVKYAEALDRMGRADDADQAA